jgi:hypothetical protein
VRVKKKPQKQKRFPGRQMPIPSKASKVFIHSVTWVRRSKEYRQHVALLLEHRQLVSLYNLSMCLLFLLNTTKNLINWQKSWETSNFYIHFTLQHQ